MNKKSKFLVFLLSPLPGLSHLYLGWTRRALVFFAVFLGLCFSGITIINMSHQFSLSNSFGPLMFFVIALVWFLALAEALSLAGHGTDLNSLENAESSQNLEELGLLLISDRKIIALALATIPGAGHMFLGLIKQGAQLMAGFFLILVLADWLNVSVLGFILPVVWFYSVFDIYHLLEDEHELHLDSSSLFDWFSNHPGILGWGLIGLGVIVLLQRIATPLLGMFVGPSLRAYLGTTLVAILLIAGGIKLLMGSKVEKEVLPQALPPAKEPQKGRNGQDEGQDTKEEVL